jgi:hypothetical protein
VIGRQLGELTAAQEVRAGVADVCQGKPVAVGEDGGERGGHTCPSGIGRHPVGEMPEGKLDELTEYAEQVCRLRRQGSSRGHGDGAQRECDAGRRDLARGLPADPIGNQKHVRSGEGRVFVVAADAADMAFGEICESHGHPPSASCPWPLTPRPVRGAGRYGHHARTRRDYAIRRVEQRRTRRPEATCLKHQVAHDCRASGGEGVSRIMWSQDNGTGPWHRTLALCQVTCDGFAPSDVRHEVWEAEVATVRSLPEAAPALPPGGVSERLLPP